MGMDPVSGEEAYEITIQLVGQDAAVHYQAFKEYRKELERFLDAANSIEDAKNPDPANPGHGKPLRVRVIKEGARPKVS